MTATPSPSNARNWLSLPVCYAAGFVIAFTLALVLGYPPGEQRGKLIAVGAGLGLVIGAVLNHLNRPKAKMQL